MTHQLFLYVDEAAAAAAFAELAADANACGWMISTMNPQETGKLLRLRSQDPVEYQQMEDQYWLHDAIVLRDHKALFLAHSDTKGAGMTSNVADQELDRMIAPVCDAGLVCR